MTRPSPFLLPESHTSAESLAILHLKRDLLDATILCTHDDENLGYAEGKVTTTRFGNFPHSTLIDRPWGSQVKASVVDTGTRGRVGTLQGRGKKRKRGGSATSHRDDIATENNGADERKGKEDADQESKNVKVAVPADTGFCHVLPPTPELWTASLPHRTQVVYTPDYSYIVQRLQIRPGSVVIEAGAGSGSFTHAAARAAFNGHPAEEEVCGVSELLNGDSQRGSGLAAGKIWSFEFHEPRAKALLTEIRDHGLEGLVEITHRDVYQDGFSFPESAHREPLNTTAVFLDLPAPWLALKHLTRSDSSPLNPSSSIHLCTFSPCIEQVQRTVSALRALGWLEIEMVELSAHRIEVKRERVGLQEEGLGGVIPTPASIDEAVGRLRELEGRDRSFHYGLTVQAMNEGQGADGKSVDIEAGDEEYVSKQQRLRNIKDAQAGRKLYKEGRLIHRSEPELKTHTSYLVFAVLPRAWTIEDEKAAQEALVAQNAESGSKDLEKPMSKRQMKKAAKANAGGDKDAEIEMKWQLQNNG